MKPIIGQEAICSDGLGRVNPFGDRIAGSRWIKVDTYIKSWSCKWDEGNVELINLHGYLQGYTRDK